MSHYDFHGTSRDADLLMGVAALLELLDAEEDVDYSVFHRRYLGSKGIKRTRNSVERMFHQLGGHAEKAYKSSLERFNLLHSLAYWQKSPAAQPVPGQMYFCAFTTSRGGGGVTG